MGIASDGARLSCVGSVLLLTLTMPIAPAALSLNQMFPSGPEVIPVGCDVAGVANSVTYFWVVVLITPTDDDTKPVPPELGTDSVNQMLPSGPTVMAAGSCVPPPVFGKLTWPITVSDVGLKDSDPAGFRKPQVPVRTRRDL